MFPFANFVCYTKRINRKQIKGARYELRSSQNPSKNRSQHQERADACISPPNRWLNYFVNYFDLNVCNSKQTCYTKRINKQNEVQEDGKEKICKNEQSGY